MEQNSLLGVERLTAIERCSQRCTILQNVDEAPAKAGAGKSPRNIPVLGIFIILSVAALYFARDFFLPVLAAFILALMLSPVVRFFSRIRVPSIITSFVLVSMLAAISVAAIYSVAVPLADWVDRAPQIGLQFRQKLTDLRAPVQAVMDAQKEVQEATSTKGETTQTVVIEGPGLIQTAASNLFKGVATFLVSLVLLAFLLSSGDMFYAKLVGAFDRLSDKKRALRIAHDIERVVSRYLFTITIINMCLGIVIGAGLYLLDMPSPYIWGAVAAIANFIPYIGALIGLGIVTVVAVVSFDTLGQALAISAFYFSCTLIEGQVITPVVVGRRLELNAVAVFLAIAFWAWLWGIVGALVAVPVLVILKTICDHSDPLKPLGSFLAADNDR